MIDDILQADLGPVNMGGRAFPLIQFTSKYILNGEDFYDRLAEYHAVDVMTYTCSYKAWTDTDIRLRRVIYQLGKAPEGAIRVRDCHIKLYICYPKRGRGVDAYVGSQNLVAPTNNNLMVLAPQPRLLKVFFDQTWSKLSNRVVGKTENITHNT